MLKLYITYCTLAVLPDTTDSVDKYRFSITPVKIGKCKLLFLLDSCFRRNDIFMIFRTLSTE